MEEDYIVLRGLDIPWKNNGWFKKDTFRLIGGVYIPFSVKGTVTIFSPRVEFEISETGKVGQVYRPVPHQWVEQITELVTTP